MAAPSGAAAEMELLQPNRIDQHEIDIATFEPQQENQYGNNQRDDETQTCNSSLNMDATATLSDRSLQSGYRFRDMSAQTCITDHYQPLSRENNVNLFRSSEYRYGQGMSSASTAPTAVRQNMHLKSGFFNTVYYAI